MPSADRIPIEIEVYQILGDLSTCACVPPGVMGRVYRVLDQMRFERSPQEEIEMVERLALLLHRTRIGLAGADELHRSVHRITSAWLTLRIPGNSLADGQAPGDIPAHPWLSRAKP